VSSRAGVGTGLELVLTGHCLTSTLFRRWTEGDPDLPSHYPEHVFRRRSATEAAPTEAEAPVEKADGKGRPTPKRREAEAARKARVTAPKDRREALRAQREKSRVERMKVQQAMQTGDERYLPLRDKGPVRRFARDYVDARRTLAEYLLPFFLVILLLMMLPPNVPYVREISLYLWLAAIIIVPVDLIFLGVRFRKELKTRFPDDSHKGVTVYAIMRSTQLRRLRLPKPQVKPGAKV
jgi:Protein of unknown function (DUF3043)